MSGLSLRVCTLLAWLAPLACGDDDGGQGTACGDTRCSAGQVCCLDCDGRGLCGAPGAICPGSACQPYGADGGSGIMCGETTCQPGQICCIDCDGRGSCGGPGTACTGAACLPDAGARFPCGNILCEGSQTCCGTCEEPYCGPPGSDCPSPGRSCTACGNLDQTCCTNECLDGLECCSGVPYPEGGVCDDACEAVSDRAAKEGVSRVDPTDVLERLVSIPITSWSYRAEGPSVRHLGPMAQDFHAAYGLGRSDRRIDLVDANGVAFAAIQALHRSVEDLRRDNESLRRELDEVKGRLEECGPSH